jgi:hypothetical protein
MCHQSPAKLLRSVKRITSFLEKKNICPNSNIKCQPLLSLHHLPKVDIPPAPTPPTVLSCTTLARTSIGPVNKVKPKLIVVKTSSTSVSPRPVYHPAVVNASQAMFRKHPSQLMPEEVQKFKNYQEHKIRIGEPLEMEVIFLPIGGTRTCINCGELT